MIGWQPNISAGQSNQAWKEKPGAARGETVMGQYPPPTRPGEVKSANIGEIVTALAQETAALHDALTALEERLSPVTSGADTPNMARPERPMLESNSLAGRELLDVLGKVLAAQERITSLRVRLDL